MPTEPHRYSLAELLNETPEGWQRSITGPLFMKSHRHKLQQFPGKIPPVSGVHYIQPNPTNNSEWLYTWSGIRPLPGAPPPKGPWSTPHLGMALVDDWLEANT